MTEREKFLAYAASRDLDVSLMDKGNVGAWLTGASEDAALGWTAWQVWQARAALDTPVDTHAWRHGNFFDYCAVCWAERQGHDNPTCPGVPQSDEEPGA